MSETDCIFCKIASGEVPATKIFEDDDLVAFEDIKPAAPVHFLVIPKRHVSTLNDLEEESSSLLGKMMLAAVRLAKMKGVDESGFRQVINCNPEGGQVVYHLHLHILGGRQMGPMG